MNKKTLILKSNKNDFEDFYIKKMQNNQADTYPIYSSRSGIMWWLTVICIQKFGLYNAHFFYGSWKKHIKEYDSVIVFDRNLNWNIFKYLKKIKPNIRCIAWYWNPIDEFLTKSFPTKTMNYCEVWSFDKGNCQRFGYHTNIQFYFKNIRNSKRTIIYDALFIGTDKGRYDVINEIDSRLKNLNKQTYIGIVKSGNSEPDRPYIKNMSYDNILNFIQASNCIIDVPQAGQSGITLRVLESIFLKKKLITTNKHIYEFEFYSDSNFFVWDNPTDADIVDFLKKPFQEIDGDVLNNYTFEKWLENFNVDVANI